MVICLEECKGMFALGLLMALAVFYFVILLFPIIEKDKKKDL